MQRNPSNNCVASWLKFTAMLKRLKLIVAGMEKHPRTCRSWLNTTITAVNEAIGFTEETNSNPARMRTI